MRTLLLTLAGLVVAVGLTMPQWARAGGVDSASVVYLLDGHTLDASGKGNDGTHEVAGFLGGAIDGVPVEFSDDVPFAYAGNKSAVFNDFTDFLNPNQMVHALMTPSDASHFVGANSFTASGWIKPTSGNHFTNGNMMLIRKGTLPRTIEGRFNFQTRPMGFPRMVGLDVDPAGDQFSFLTADNQVVADQWNHITFVVDKTAGQAFIYLNGALQTTVVPEVNNGDSLTSPDQIDGLDAPTSATTHPILWGRFARESVRNDFTSPNILDAGAKFIGLMDELRFTMKALSPSEVMDDFQDSLILAADFNNDGVVDAGDIAALCDALDQGTVPPADDKFDLDGDGNVNSQDADLLIRAYLGTEYGDTDLNGQVSLGDLGALAANFNDAGTFGWADGDFNWDGIVTLADLGLLAASFGFGVDDLVSGGESLSFDDGVLQTFGVSLAELVPEPATALLLLGMGAFALVRRR